MESAPLIYKIIFPSGDLRITDCLFLFKIYNLVLIIKIIPSAIKL